MTPRFRIQQTPIFVNIDPNLIRTVLVHFLNNAVQHTKKGHVELNYWKQDNGVYVEVKDTGTGLPESLKENIFALLSETPEIRKALEDSQRH